jgi:hypothetical protein
VPQRKFKTNIVVCLRPEEAGWFRATILGVPAVVTAGMSREDACEMAVVALVQVLGAEPEREADGTYERVRLEVSTVRAVQRDTGGRGRPKSPARSASESS